MLVAFDAREYAQDKCSRAQITDTAAHESETYAHDECLAKVEHCLEEPVPAGCAGTK